MLGAPRRTLRRLAASGLLMALTLAAPVASAQTAGTIRPLAAGPVFADGGGLAWATYDRDLVQTGGVFGFVVRHRAPDGGVRVIGTSRPEANSDEERTPYLLAAPGAIVAGSLARTTGSAAFPPGAAAAEVLAWDGTGASGVRFGACASAVGAPTLRPGVVDLDAGTVVDCDSDGRHIDLFDARTGARRDQIAASRPVSARIAGPYVAWLEPAASADAVGRYTLVVFDRASRAEVLRTATTTLGDGAFSAWDLGSDGTVVYAIGRARTGSADPGRLGWTSVADPRPHLIAAGAVRVPVLRLEGRTITYTSLVGTTFHLRTTTLDGTASRTIAHGTGRDFDLRGSRIVFGVRGCTQDTIRVQSITARTYAPGRHRCPLPVARTLTAHGTSVKVTLDCRGLPFSCDGDLTLRAGNSSRGTVFGRGEIRAGRATVRLTAAARRALRRRGVLSARLSANLPSIYDEDTSLVRAREVSISLSGRR